MNKILAFLGVQANSTLAEKVLATIGGSFSILAISLVSFQTTGSTGAAAIVPSMGAATVLLFAVPHGPLSQPWALFAGNLSSATVGVTCALAIPNIFVASALSVGLAIGVMHILRCVHPPGGATALAAVIGGAQVHELGYLYVVIPTLLNCVIIFIFAVIFNGLFPWRRYPLSLMKYKSVATLGLLPSVTLQDAENALEKSETPVDIAPTQLLNLVKATLAQERIRNPGIPIELGGVYTNNKPGAEWAVRKIVDEHRSEDISRDMVIYTSVDGQGLNKSGSCTRVEFQQWAKVRLKTSATVD